MTFRTKFLLFVSICVPPNNPITACGATSFPGYHSFPKWAILGYSLICMKCTLTRFETEAQENSENSLFRWNRSKAREVVTQWSISKGRLAFSKLFGCGTDTFSIRPKFLVLGFPYLPSPRPVYAHRLQQDSGMQTLRSTETINLDVVPMKRNQSRLV